MENGSRRRAADTLSRENWRHWFKKLENHLKSKEVCWLIEDLQNIEAKTPSSSRTPSLRGTAEGFPGLEHSSHSPTWVKDNAKATYELTDCLSQDD